MQIYNVLQGQPGFLITPDGVSHPFDLRVNLTVDRDDIILDPVRLYNQVNQTGKIEIPEEPLDRKAWLLATLGYTVFQLKGRRSDQRYGFALKINRSHTWMD